MTASLLRRACLLYTALAVTGLFVLGYETELSQRVVRGLERSIISSNSVLVVTAHPDDEVIFFSPTILSLRQRHREVHILCFTTGNARGLGHVRVQELKSAAAALKVDQEHLVVVNDSRIQDGKDEHWPINLMAQIIAEEVADRHIDTVVTFDQRGVYGHVNHAACQSAVRRYADLCWQQAGVEAAACPSTWMLVSEPARKFAGAVSIMRSVSACKWQHHACFISPSPLRTLWAMSYHTTQWRWWRHVLTTPYTFVNSLDEIASELPEEAAGQRLQAAAAPKLPNSARAARLLHSRASLSAREAPS